MRKLKKIRLLTVGTLFVLVTLVIWARLVQIQIFERDHYLDRGKNQWEVAREVPAVRGNIFDRNGKPLALSIRSCSVGIQPREVERPNEVASVLARELQVSRTSVQKKLRSKSNFVWVRRQCTLTEAARNRIRGLRGVTIEWEADRVYPYGAIAAKVVGFVGHDAKGGAGIEVALDAELRGNPGWEVVQRDGSYRSGGYHTYAEQKPIDGRHVVLTIDVALQEIAEFELEQAVIRTEAKGGELIVMECATGDILALAEYPAPRNREGDCAIDSLWTIRSVSHMFEPGSTFKLITAAALLETGRVQTFDVFDAENGRADLGVAIIRDSHPYDFLTFREGFVFSSNIVMAKACQFLEPLEFLKYIRLFGFGTKTNIRFLGESAGLVAPIDQWSDRTQITMAFGQEIAVTGVQLVNAYAAVANNGLLVAPRIIKSIIDEGSGKSQDFEPVKIRNVISKETAQRLRGFCRSVVEEGTGKKAGLDYLEVCGKTGTAEKASASGGYLRNRYLASFVGFVPYDQPKIACLVVLDEPSYYNRFGGVSAAPVFARISSALASTSNLFDDVLVTNVLDLEPRGERQLRAPNFLRLTKDAAMDMARYLGMNVLCKGTSGEVISQTPGPGVAMSQDDVVRLELNGSPELTARKIVPDLRGMSIREAKRHAIKAGYRCHITGTGVVKSQSPKPGTQSKSDVIKIVCKSRAVERG